MTTVPWKSPFRILGTPVPGVGTPVAGGVWALSVDKTLAPPGQTSRDSDYDTGFRGPLNGYGSCGGAGWQPAAGWPFFVGRQVTAAPERQGPVFSGAARVSHHQTTVERGPDA